MIKDVEICRIFGIPSTTLRDFKNADAGNWRKQVYGYLKQFEKKITMKELISGKQAEFVPVEMYTPALYSWVLAKIAADEEYVEILLDLFKILKNRQERADDFIYFQAIQKYNQKADIFLYLNVFAPVIILDFNQNYQFLNTSDENLKKHLFEIFSQAKSMFSNVHELSGGQS